MPITKSAKKAWRQSLRRGAQNIKRKEEYKQIAKNFKKLVAQAASDEARALVPKLYKSLDKAAKTNAIKKNAARRLKSRLTRILTPAKTK